jgi:uncharacterized membrane protein
MLIHRSGEPTLSRPLLSPTAKSAATMACAQQTTKEAAQRLKEGTRHAYPIALVASP